MAIVPLKDWHRYRDVLARINVKAADDFRDAIWNKNGPFKGVGLNNIPAEDLINYAYHLATKYGEASAAYSAEFYDEIAALSKANVPPAVPAETASVTDTRKAVLATMGNENMLVGSIGRLVKRAGQDTILQNAIRDHAETAWIPSGDTCAFCIMLASRGWEYASTASLKNGHAQHIHANCDCAYGVRFDSDWDVAGYDNGKKYYQQYVEAGNSAKERLHNLRAGLDEKNAVKIRAQKHAAYEARKEE